MAKDVRDLWKAEFKKAYSSKEFYSYDLGSKLIAFCPYFDCQGARGHKTLEFNCLTGLWKCTVCGRNGDIHDLYERNFKRSPISIDEIMYKPIKKDKKGNITRGAAIFQPTEMTKRILENHKLATIGGTLYQYNRGVFKKATEKIVYQECKQILQNDLLMSRVNEIEKQVENETYVHEHNVNRDGIDFINLKNGRYNWREGKLYPHSPEYMNISQIPVKCRLSNYLLLQSSN